MNNRQTGNIMQYTISKAGKGYLLTVMRGSDIVTMQSWVSRGLAAMEARRLLAIPEYKVADIYI